ncbi:hypothetical protein [Streptomyces sp. CA-106110]|uniref:hypothetical protein n=1 Tax=Streptomyces sp. CA-106110 TaxID=3240044 RepID=UPI003D8E13E0
MRIAVCRQDCEPLPRNLGQPQEATRVHRRQRRGDHLRIGLCEDSPHSGQQPVVRLVAQCATHGVERPVRRGGLRLGRQFLERRPKRMT